MRNVIRCTFCSEDTDATLFQPVCPKCGQSVSLEDVEVSEAIENVSAAPSGRSLLVLNIVLCLIGVFCAVAVEFFIALGSGLSYDAAFAGTRSILTRIWLPAIFAGLLSLKTKFWGAVFLTACVWSAFFPTVLCIGVFYVLLAVYFFIPRKQAV